MANHLNEEIDHYLTLDYRVTVEPDRCGNELCYMARNPELRGCMSHGATPDEAVANLREARELYLTTMIENGLRPPLPEPPVAAASAGSGAAGYPAPRR